MKATVQGSREDDSVITCLVADNHESVRPVVEWKTIGKFREQVRTVVCECDIRMLRNHAVQDHLSVQMAAFNYLSLLQTAISYQMAYLVVASQDGLSINPADASPAPTVTVFKLLSISCLMVMALLSIAIIQHSETMEGCCIATHTIVATRLSLTCPDFGRFRSRPL
ncbi:hypothetical protein BC831DRAFT_28132 [Entophlyctis helioformis]|nr:hypothetical protein BC831DRAFT_28132 [Entophlyctis helioformis]